MDPQNRVLPQVYGVRYVRTEDAQRKVLSWFRLSDLPSGWTLQAWRIWLVADADGNHNLLATLPPDAHSWTVPAALYGRFFYVTALFTRGDEWRPQPDSPTYIPGDDGEPDEMGGKFPQWYQSLPADEQAALYSQDWFQGWLQTTPELDSDCRHVFRDNPDFADRLVWRTDSRVLFHGDELGRLPDEIFTTGMLAYQSVCGRMNMKQEPLGGDLVSYSYSLNIARIYSHPSAPGPDAHPGIFLTVPGEAAASGLCVDQTLSGGEGEVAYLSGVRRDFILGAFSLSGATGMTLSAFTPNPGCTQYPEMARFLADDGLAMLILSVMPASGEAVMLHDGSTTDTVIDALPVLVNARHGTVVLYTRSGQARHWSVNARPMTNTPQASILIDLQMDTVDRLAVIELT